MKSSAFGGTFAKPHKPRLKPLKSEWIKIKREIKLNKILK
jgi:hypothetical protein